MNLILTWTLTLNPALTLVLTLTLNPALTLVLTLVLTLALTLVLMIDRCGWEDNNSESGTLKIHGIEQEAA